MSASRWGKGHAEKGAQLTRVIAPAPWAWRKTQAALAEFLVRQHLTMSHLSQRRDLSDPAVIERFAGKVGGEESPGLSVSVHPLRYRHDRAGQSFGVEERAPPRAVFAFLGPYARRGFGAEQRSRCRSGQGAPAIDRALVRPQRIRLRAIRAADASEADDDATRQRVAALVAGIDERFFTTLTPRQLARQVRLVLAPSRVDSADRDRSVALPRSRDTASWRSWPTMSAVCSPPSRGPWPPIASMSLGAVIGTLQPDPQAREMVALDLFYVRDLYGKAIPGDDPALGALPQ